MRRVQDWDVTDLENLCNIKAEESSSLEFKGSAALINTPKNKEEMCKDVSAMANAAGGIIVYGISEGSSGEADYIDSGCNPDNVKPEWIDQVLTSGIEPRISGLTIVALNLESGNRCYAVEVAQATVFAPHQVRSAKRYFKRTERRVEAMLDYEIRDVFRRATTPHLYVELSPFKKPDNVYLVCNIGNKSSEPALYTIVQFMFDKELGIEGLPYSETTLRNLIIDNTNGIKIFADVISVKLSVPRNFPVFREALLTLFEVPIRLTPNKSYPFRYNISCPGFRVSRSGKIVTLGDNVTVEYSDDLS